MSTAHAKQAIERARSELSSYYHPACETETEVNDRVIAIAALDPWHFPLTDTECAGCGSAPMKDVVLADQRSLYEAFDAMRDSVPLSGKLMRFVGIPLGFAFLGLCAALVVAKRNPGQAIIVLSALGLIVGSFANRYVFRAFRRMGFFW